MVKNSLEADDIQNYNKQTFDFDFFELFQAVFR